MARKPRFNAAAAAAPPFSAAEVKAFLDAAHDNSVERLQALIDKHGNGIVHVVDTEGKGAIAYAALSAKKANISLLLKKGAEIDAPDNEGVTALMVASGRGFKDLANFLLEVGARIEATDKQGWTPLMHAAYHSTTRSPISNPSPLMSKRKLDTIEFLLAWGANIDATDKQGWTVERQATARRNRDALPLFSAERQKRAEKKADYKRQLESAFSELANGRATEVAAPMKAAFKKPARLAP